MTQIPDIRLPELTGSTEAEQLLQIQHYLYRLAEQLQFAFSTVSQEQDSIRSAQNAAVRTPEQTFSSLKSLIVKSADVVQTISQQVEQKLEGSYVAQSQFGTFQQETEQRIAATDQNIEQRFRILQEVTSLVEQINSSLLEVNAYIRTGLLFHSEDGAPVYGVEIGQQNLVDGTVTFRKFARLAADRLSFYDANDTEVAYISDYQLHVTGARIYQLITEETTARQLHMGDYSWALGYDGHLSLN